MSSIIKFNAQDLLSDSDMVLFTPSEMGCYIRLVSHYWLKGELPTDVSALAKLSGCSIGHFKDIWPRVSEQFVVSDGGVITCPSFDKQRSKAKENLNACRKLLKNDGLKRKRHEQSTGVPVLCWRLPFIITGYFADS